MKKPLLSVVITTKNEEKNIKNCLESIKKQTYKDIEVIVVDNNSTDGTKEIAEKYTKLVFNKGPERSAQRNFGAKKAKGNYLLFLDADMILTPKVLEACVRKVQEDKNIQALIIPEKSFGEGFWAQCKALERSFYVGNDFIEAARFYSRDIFKNIGGFDEKLTGPEDWDLSQRVKNKFFMDRVSTYILHNEGRLSLLSTIRKKYYYSKKIVQYLNKKGNQNQKKQQVSFIKRYWLFLSQPRKLFGHPVLGLSMLFMKTMEFGAGAIGILLQLRENVIE